MPSPTDLRATVPAPVAAVSDGAAVTVRELTAGYNGQAAVEALSFSVPRGSMVALIGPNGSGKSTLIKALLGLLPLWAGGVSVLGRSPEEARPLIGYMPQAEQVDWSFPISVREVVAMGRYRRDWRPSRLRGLLGRREPAVERALERARVGHLASRQIGELSGGQQRRVLLARTLVRDPELFLLDEPAAGLDATVEEDMLELFQELAAAGKTLIVATHDLPCVMRCYGLALCLNRRLVAYGRSAEVLTEATLTEAFGRHLVLYQVGGQQYAMEPHVEHPAHEP